jgi:hypothetical protein
MRFLLCLKRQQPQLKFSKESLEHKLIFLLNNVTDGLGREQMLILLNHFDQPFDLFFVGLPHFLVAFYFELQTTRLINPIGALPPSQTVPQFLKNVLKLFLRRIHIILLRVDDQVIVLCEQRYQSSLFLLCAPRQLLEKKEKLILVYSVPFGQTAHIYDGVESYSITLKLLQNLLTDVGTVINLIESGDVQHSKADLFPRCLKSSALVVVDVSGDLLEAVGDFNGGVAGEEFGGCTLAASRTPNYQNIKLSYPLHAV